MLGGGLPPRLSRILLHLTKGARGLVLWLPQGPTCPALFPWRQVGLLQPRLVLREDKVSFFPLLWPALWMFLT